MEQRTNNLTTQTQIQKLYKLKNKPLTRDVFIIMQKKRENHSQKLCCYENTKTFVDLN